MKLLIAVALLAVPARAAEYSYNVRQPDAQAILERLEASTGLQFEAKCGTCAAHGELHTAPGSVRVVVFTSGGQRRKAAKLTADLKKKIGQAVLGR